MDSGGPVLAIEAAGCCIVVNRRSLDLLQVLDVLGVGVQGANAGARRRPSIGALKLGVRQRIHEDVDDLTTEIPWWARTQQRQDQVGTFPEGPSTQSEAEVRAVIWDSHLGGDIDQASNSQGAVQGDPNKRSPCSAEPALQHVVAERHRLVEIANNIVDAVAGKFWNCVIVKLGYRTGEVVLDFRVKLKDGTVRPLERVVLRESLKVRGRATSC